MAQTTNISIPKRHRSALAKLVAMPAGQLTNFANSLKKAKPEPSIFALARQLSVGGSEISFNEICDILEMLASLYRYRDDFGVTRNQLVDAFISAAKKETASGETSSITAWARLRESLIAIFARAGSLGITIKSSEFSREHERNFCPASSRVLTDIRPVFVSSPSDAPVAAIIQHTLKIAYHPHADSDKTEEFFVTLDEDDVDVLIYRLMRAKDREKGLRKFLKSTGIQLMASAEDSK
jgi:hypothetical protein